MEASELERAAQRLPSAETLVELARRRLDAELRALPPEGSAAWRAALLTEAPRPGASFGALAHAIRVAKRAGRMAEAQALFVALLQRIDGLNRRWVAGVVWHAPAASTERRDWAQDLMQELTLQLWERIGLRDEEAWELFFQRALAFAQSHVAMTYLRRRGSRGQGGETPPGRGRLVVLSGLSAALDDEARSIVVDDAASSLTRAELADLRDLVSRLPERERLAVVMRYWQQASEAEIAGALGDISTRAVRYTLRRAYGRLRAWYAGEEQPAPHSGEDADDSE